MDAEAARHTPVPHQGMVSSLPITNCSCLGAVELHACSSKPKKRMLPCRYIIESLFSTIDGERTVMEFRALREK